MYCFIFFFLKSYFTFHCSKEIFPSLVSVLQLFLNWYFITCLSASTDFNVIFKTLLVRRSSLFLIVLYTCSLILSLHFFPLLRTHTSFLRVHICFASYICFLFYARSTCMSLFTHIYPLFFRLRTKKTR